MNANISILKNTSGIAYPISVIVDGECNHADTYPEQIDCGGLVHDRVGDLDWQDDWQSAEVCQKCQAYRFDYDDEWFGVTDMPMIIATNSGKLIHDVERMPF